MTKGWGYGRPDPDIREGGGLKNIFGPSDLSLVYKYGGPASSPGSATEDPGVSIRSFTVPKSTFLVVFEQKLKAVPFCT